MTNNQWLGVAAIAATAEFGLFLFCVAGAHGWIVLLDHASSTDFLSFHAAGALASAGTPWLVYDRAAHQAAETAAIGAATAYNYFYYPPVYLLICAPLARLPYLVAFVAFQVICGLAFVLAVRLIRRDLPIVVILAFPGVWWAIGTGQNALLTAALFAAGTAWLERRPILAGICLGALCYKPQFGLLLPVALIAGRHWRVCAGAALASLGLIALSAILFGLRTWTAFLSAMAGSGKVYAAHAIFMGGLTSPYGALMTFGAPRDIAFVIQAVAIMVMAAIVARVWARGAPSQIRAAMLLTATSIAVPVMMFYDLMLVLVALIWLSRAVPPVFDRTAVSAALAAVAFLGPLFSGNLATDGHWLVAPITAGAAFSLSLIAAWPILSQSAGPVMARPA